MARGHYGTGLRRRRMRRPGVAAIRRARGGAAPEFPGPDMTRRVIEAIGGGDRMYANIAAGGRQPGGHHPVRTLSRLAPGRTRLAAVSRAGATSGVAPQLAVCGVHQARGRLLHLGGHADGVQSRHRRTICEVGTMAAGTPTIASFTARGPTRPASTPRSAPCSARDSAPSASPTRSRSGCRLGLPC